jgi:hypothetical protein
MKLNQAVDIVTELAGQRPRNITTSFRAFVIKCEKPKSATLSMIRNFFWYVIPSTSNDGEMIYMPPFWLWFRDLTIYFMLHETLHQVNPMSPEAFVQLETKRRFAAWKISLTRHSKK